jgi:hypothetical protein
MVTSHLSDGNSRTYEKSCKESTTTIQPTSCLKRQREKQGHFSEVNVAKNTNENGDPFAAAVLNTCRKKDRP